MMKSYPALPDSPWLAVVSMTRQQVACHKPAEDHTFFSFLWFSLSENLYLSRVSLCLIFSLIASTCRGLSFLTNSLFGKMRQMSTKTPHMTSQAYAIKCTYPHTRQHTQTPALYFLLIPSFSSSEAFLSTPASFCLIWCSSVKWASMSRTTLAQHVWMLYQHTHKSSRVIMWGFVLGCIWWMSQTILVGLQSTPGALWDRSSSIPIRGITYQPMAKWMLNGLLKTNTLSLTYTQSMFGGSGSYTTLFKGKSGKLYFSTNPKKKDWNHQLIYLQVLSV